MKIKLIIWDLDDTLWHGTLADGDDVQLHEKRAGILRRLNGQGIVSAICSKNDPDKARERLEHFGLWDQIVFPRIGFQPKGEAVAGLIADMQLLPKNVLFVDDNIHNLEEVKHRLPDINIIDAATPACDLLLAAIVKSSRAVRKSRVEDYRILERITADRRASTGSPEEFLRSCNLHIAIARRGDNLPFAARIEGLINRSNQMNFTKSRARKGAVHKKLLGPILEFDSWSIFAWDRYGYHGLVGFLAHSRKRKILHFVFSCRIMHMGIEQHVLALILKRFHRLGHAKIRVTPAECDWITVEEFAREPTRSFVLGHEGKAPVSNPSVHIMFDCQSASIAHFGGLADIAETDVWPRRFKIRFMLNMTHLPARIAPLIVYGAFTDYADNWSPDPTWDDAVYADCAARFAKAVADSNRLALIALPPRTARMEDKRGVTAARVNAYNDVWEDIARTNPNIHLLDISGLDVPDGIPDVRHYDVAVLKRLAAKIAEWVRAQETAGLPVIKQPEAAPAETQPKDVQSFDSAEQGD